MKNRCATALFWFWNDNPTPAGIRRQLNSFKAAGFQAVYIHPMPDSFFKDFFYKGMEIEYLGKEYFTMVRLALEECKRLGLSLLLYDEGGWPSGGVVGRLLADHPECQAKVLRRLPDGETYLANNKWPMPIPDFLDRHSTEIFIEMVYERYYAELGDEFGKTIKGIFTDEPIFFCRPGSDEIRFHPNIVKVLRRKHGLDFWHDVLPRLWNASKDNEITIQMRRKYLDVCSDLFARNFSQVISQWCRKHNIALEGHLMEDDVFFLTGAEMDFLKGLDAFNVPGVDAIWRQIYPDEAAKSAHYARFASSAAMRRHRQETLCECFNVYGYGLTGATMNWVACSLMINGINRLCIMPSLYCDKGLRKVCCSTDTAPRLPLWDAMPALNRFWQWAADYDVGALDADVWIYARCAYPAPDEYESPPPKCQKADAEMEKLMDALDSAGVLWRFANELDIHTGHKPPCLLLAPNGTDLPPDKLAWFPRIETHIPSDIAAFAALDFVTLDGCRVRPVRRDDGDAVMLFNPSKRNAVIKFHSKEQWRELLPPDDLYHCLHPLVQDGSIVTVNMPPWGLRLIRKGVAAPVEAWRPADTIPLTLRIVKKESLRLSLDAPTHYETTICDEPLPKSGLYSDEFPDFSGRITMEAVMESLCAGMFIFELQCMANAVRVSCNGRLAGERAFGPWLFAVRLKKGANRLRIRVSSSAGNEYRRCYREELKPAGYFNAYSERIEKFTVDDAAFGCKPSMTLYKRP